MKKFWKVLTLMLVVATIAALSITTFVACSDNNKMSQEEIKEQTKGETQKGNYSDQTLVVATNAEFAPYEYVENNEFVGFDMDLAKEIGKVLGYKEVKIENMAFDSIVTKVQAEKGTIAMAGMTINPTRLEAVNFSNPYMADAYQLIVVKATNTKFDACKTADDVLKVIADNNMTVNYAMAQTGQYYVEGNEAMKYPGITCGKKVSQQSIPLAFSAIADDNTVSFADNGVAKEFCEENTAYKVIDIAITKENYGIAVNKENLDLLNDINFALKTLKDNGKINELAQKYGIVEVK